ncbi:AP-3 complex subunit mu-2, partial [Perkinsus olseni]
VLGNEDDDEKQQSQPSSSSGSSSSQATADSEENLSSIRSDAEDLETPVKMFQRITGVSWDRTRALAAQMCRTVTAFSDYEQRTEIFARVHKRHLENQKADTKQGYKHYWWIRCDRCGKYRRAPYYIAKQHGVDNETPPEFHCGLLQQRL